MAELRLDLSRVDQDLGQLQSYDLQGGMGEPVEEADPFSDEYGMDERLSPLEKLDKYFQSEDLGERELAVRYIIEAIHTISTYAEYELLVEITFAMANDIEPLIRMGILNTVGYLLERNEEIGEDMAADTEERLFDVPIRMLTDINQQVRRVSQNCVANLLEEDRGNRNVLIRQLLPTIVRCLNRDENYDLRMDMALLMSRLAAVFGGDLCLRHFVPLLPSLSSDTMFHVRKAFVISCKELCPILGEDGAEQHILPLFLTLCKDEVWGVRKACADMFADVSASCNLGTRHDRLTPSFLHLLNDDSRWVRKAAFQSLGPFISTFYVSQSEDSFDDSSIEPLGDSVLMDNSLLDSSTFASREEERHSPPSATSSPLSSTAMHQGTGIRNGQNSREVVDGEEFGNFVFWRSPIPHLGTERGLQTDTIVEDLEQLLVEGETREHPIAEGETREHPIAEGETREHPIAEGEMREHPIAEGETREHPIAEGEMREHLIAEGEMREHPIAEGSGTESESSVGTNRVSTKLSFGEGDGCEKVTDEDPRPEDQRDDGREQMGSGSEESNMVEADQTNSEERTPSDVSTSTDHTQPEPSDVSTSTDHTQPEPSDVSTSTDHTQPEPSDVSTSTDHTQPEPSDVNTSTDHTQPEPSDVSTSTDHTQPEPSDVSTSTDHTQPEPSDVNTSTDHTQPEPSDVSTSTDHTQPEPSDVSTSTDHTQPEPSDVSTSTDHTQPEPSDVSTSTDHTQSVEEPPVEGSLSENDVTLQQQQQQQEEEESNSFPQVRVFVHSASGQVMEQDLSLVGHGPSPLSDAITSTTTKSVAMDLTLGMDDLPSDTFFKSPLQEIVPDDLMEIYLSMTDQVKAQTVDSDLPFYCAYSLPAVALTLGQENWSLLKPTFDTLAQDMQWKIRQVLAYSLHELGRILGSQRTCSDILPVFEEYCTKDIDDVKIGALTHLGEFFELLPSDVRMTHLPHILQGLVDLENDRNWRYRNALAEQLICLCDLCGCDYLHTHIYPIALTLVEDKVAEVRRTATHLLGILLYKLSRNDPEQFLSTLKDIRGRYGTNERWLFRLTYVKQCGSFLTEGRVSYSVFALECLPTLFQLAKDKVPNIRIAVAKLLKETVLNIGYFQEDGKGCFSLKDLTDTLEKLRGDPDRDVRYFAGGQMADIPLRQLLLSHERQDSESHDSEFQDASEYLENDLINLELEDSGEHTSL